MNGFQRFKNKVALVTGSGRGIGRAIAEKFASEGAKVVLIDRNESELNSAAEQIKSQHDSLLPIVCDVRVESDVTKMVSRVVQKWGEIHILVNNAAVFPERIPFLDVTLERWFEVLDVNLLGVFRCTQAVAAEMVRQKTVGRIVNISSINAIRYRRATFGQTQYNVSKAALDNLTKGLAMELAPHGIIVNGIAPGFVAAPMAKQDSLEEESMKKEYLKSGRVPLGRFGTPEDCANLALFLASEDCTWMTGETIHQDGGMHFTF
jgi:NAD(P)-dependent dehydrogenase (short-subunit alcohol dehydrogenase family)